MKARALLLLGLLVLPAAARGGWRDDYDAAVQAANGRRFDEARRLVERAIAVRPKSAKGRGGYFPYFYLGVAWQGAGSCRRCTPWRCATSFPSDSQSSRWRGRRCGPRSGAARCARR